MNDECSKNEWTSKTNDYYHIVGGIKQKLKLERTLRDVEVKTKYKKHKQASNTKE